MTTGYIHVETTAAARPKHADQLSGDTWSCVREASGTTVILCDGLGHGVRAHVAATFCLARLTGLLRAGYSLRRAVELVADSMEAARGTDASYTAFCVLRILNDGIATALSYDMPGIVLLSPGHAAVLPGRTFAGERATLMETDCHLVPGEGVLLVSDGLTQAGIGRGLRLGWTLGGVATAADQFLTSGGTTSALPERLLAEADRLCQGAPGDDTTAIAVRCRTGRSLHLFTGPPANPATDRAVVARFMSEEGWKVVCGGTSASIVAAQTGRPIGVEQCSSLIAPPRNFIEGIDLVTEGAVTLNHVYNLLDTEPDLIEEDSGVSDLLRRLQAADRIKFWVGGSANPASSHLLFKQQGILSRAAIIPLMVAKLQAAGKLVVVETL